MPARSSRISLEARCRRIRASAAGQSALLTADVADPIPGLLEVKDRHGNRVDLLLGLRGMDPELLNRTRQFRLADAVLEIVGREDVIAMKAFAGGSVDLADARAVIELDRESLDLELLRRLAQRFGRDSERVVHEFIDDVDRRVVGCEVGGIARIVSTPSLSKRLAVGPDQTDGNRLNASRQNRLAPLRLAEENVAAGTLGLFRIDACIGPASIGRSRRISGCPPRKDHEGHRWSPCQKRSQEGCEGVQMALQDHPRASRPRWRTTQFVIVVLASIFGFVAGCGGDNKKKSENPVPVLTSVSPTTAVAGGAGFTLTVTGTGFIQGAQVQWAGAERATNFVGATQLSAAILASDVAQVGSFNVTVRNPAPTIGPSNALQFSVTSVPPPPPIGVSVSPATAEVEVGKTVQFTTAVTGTANTAVNWSVSGVAGGNSTVGTITDKGEYTAPLSVPWPNSLTITATSAADGTASDTATVTVAGCSLAVPGPASQQTQARLGAYYFDGWSGPLTNFHFNGLVSGPYQDRQPLTGWRDNSPCAVEQQFAWARRFGIDYFIFLWYHDPLHYEDDDLNNALQITRGLADRHGVQFAIMYTDHDPFTVRPDDWPAAVNEWIGYMVDPDYVHVNGKPMLVVYDTEAMRKAFGSSAAVADAFNQLRVAAQAHGLAGVYIVGGIFAGYDPIHQYGSFPDLSMVQTEGYDAVSMYNWSFGEVSGEQPFSILAEAGQWIWGQAALNSALPFIPAAMAGWDARPWGEPPAWFRRSPHEVTDLVCSAITWANANPQLGPEPSPGPPLVFLEAWNELGEGSYLVPTVGDGTSYGDALAAMLVAEACSPP